jgi:hypothetical protein
MLAAGEITNQEFRRLSSFPDLEQSDRLASALEERILYCLDEIVGNGDKNWDQIAPDNFILDPTDMATTLCVNYINLYAPTNLEEEKRQFLKDWFTQVQDLKAQAGSANPWLSLSPKCATTTAGPTSRCAPKSIISTNIRSPGLTN